MIKKVAVIGAGIAGLACARILRRAGCYVEVFEQDRIIGGRMATTRLGLVPFDHGAQYITARSDHFRLYIDEMMASNYAARWVPKAASGENASQLNAWFVGVPGMSSLVRPLAEGVRLHTERRVHTLRRTDKTWELWFEDETSRRPLPRRCRRDASARGQAAAGPHRRIGRVAGARPHLALLGRHGTA